jgi:hypothetical protein
MSSTATTPHTRVPRLSLSTAMVRRLLVLDAGGCAVLGAGSAAGAGVLADRLGVGSALLVSAGVALLTYAAAAGVVARVPARSGLLGLLAANTGFAAGVIVVAATAGPTTTGALVAVALAAVSLVVADLLVLGLRGLKA